MNTYISFLRGVNMAGHNSIKMADLADLYSNLGFIHPQTYIQSGNVIFNCVKDVHVAEIASAIETSILEKYGYDVPVMIRSVAQMRKILSSNPFLSEENFDPSKMAVTFIHGEVTESQIRKVAGVDYPPDKFKIIGNEIYTFCPNGFGRTKLYTNFFENKMKVKGTARSWNTITTLLDMAEKKVGTQKAF